MPSLKAGGAGFGSGSLPAPRASTVTSSDPVLKWKPLTDQANKKYPLISSGLLLGLIWVESRGNETAVSSAGAFGLTQFIPSTAPKYGVQRGNPPSQIMGAAHYLTDLINQQAGGARGTAVLIRALNDYNGAQLINGQPNPYAQNVLNAAKRYGYDPQHGGLVQGVEHAVSDAVNFATEMPKEVIKLIQTILNPSLIGKLVAEGLVFVAKLFAGAFYRYIILPPWHWTERATAYYYENVIQGDNQYGAIVTYAAWGMGYAILFGKVDPERALTAPPRETPLGRSLQTGQNLVARQALTPAKDVQKKTPEKPKEAWSAAPLDTIRTVAVQRRRPVSVSTTPTAAEVEQETERELERERRKAARSTAKERVQAARTAEALGLEDLNSPEDFPAEHRPPRMGT